MLLSLHNHHNSNSDATYFLYIAFTKVYYTKWNTKLHLIQFNNSICHFYYFSLSHHCWHHHHTHCIFGLNSWIQFFTSHTITQNASVHHTAPHIPIQLKNWKTHKTLNTLQKMNETFHSHKCQHQRNNTTIETATTRRSGIYQRTKHIT